MLRLLLLIAPLALAACQPSAPAQRAAADATALAAPADPAQCWARDTIVTARGAEERMFAVPCPQVMTPAFVASVQRALAVRGLFTGPVTAQIDATTRAAVRAFQAPQGLDSDILTLDAARQLGLVALPRGTY